MEACAGRQAGWTARGRPPAGEGSSPDRAEGVAEQVAETDIHPPVRALRYWQEIDFGRARMDAKDVADGVLDRGETVALMEPLAISERALQRTAP
jgi:hypothetical protein